MPARLQSAVPTFAVADVTATAEFYRDRLGFQIDGYWGSPPEFGIVWRDGAEVFFGRAPSETPRASSVRDMFDMYLRVDDVRALAAELKERGAEIIDGPVQRDYDQLELIVRDCNGLMITFGQQSPYTGPVCEPD